MLGFILVHWLAVVELQCMRLEWNSMADSITMATDCVGKKFVEVVSRAG